MKKPKREYRVREELSTEARDHLSEYSDMVARLLYHRGITSPSDAQNFLQPDYTHTAEHFLHLNDIEKASRRILDAIEANEKITIFADYDADGIPAAVILHDFFTKIGYENFDVYIPHRNKEGFGLNIPAIDTIHETGTTLMITVDCGISDVDQVVHANSKSIDVIITDHHEPHEELPPAYAIINPKHPACEHPEKMLCGSAVAFKLVQGLLHYGSFDIHDGWEKWLLDMVGIATISDMVPLVGENRTLAHFGLHVLRKSPRRGLHHLLRKAGVPQKHVTEGDVGFTISPRINAASRMGEPKLAFDLLSSGNDGEAGALVDHLSKINDERKGHVAAIVKEVKKHLDPSSSQVIVAGNPSWQPSLLGLVASSLADEYALPAFIWGRGDGKEIKGSCRSGATINVFDLMCAAPADTFITFGGHAGAGGFVLPLTSVDTLQETLHQAAGMQTASDPEPTYIDAPISLDDITDQLYAEISQLAPFGMGNPEPHFLIKNAAPFTVKQFGKTQNHIELSFKKNNGSLIRAIAFFKTADDFSSQPLPDTPRDYIVTIEKSAFAGRTELRMRLIDCL